MTDTKAQTQDESKYGTVPGRDVAWSESPTDDIPVTDPTATAVSWESGTSITCPSTVTGRDSTTKSNVFALLLDGVEEYKEKFGDTELDVPAYYSRFEDEFETYLATTTALGHDGETGISPTRLEQGIRLATGGGRFSSKNITVTACGRHPFVIETADAAYVMATTTLRNYEVDEIVCERDVAGMTVTNEMNETVLSGIEKAVPLLEEQFGIELVEYSARHGGRHEFVASDGSKYQLSAHNLNYVWAEIEDEIIGSHDIRYMGEHTVSVTEDDLEYPIGSEEQLVGTVVGYALEAKRTGSTYSKSREFTVRARPVGISFAEKESYTKINASDYNGKVVFKSS